MNSKAPKPIRLETAADRDVVTLGIAIAAAILFVGTGGSVMPKIARALLGVGESPDLLLTNALLLNIALIILGWRRYNQLHDEVEARRRSEAVARAQAETDPLTGCRNRRSGIPAIEALRESANDQRQEMALLMIDLDNFKQINDLNGHHVGDRVLVATAERIRELLPPNGLLARFGGDEFMCAIPYEPELRERVDRFAANLISAISQPIEDEGLRVVATVSVGIAAAPADVTQLSAEELVQRADIAMYHAKNRGRNRHYWFDPEMEREQRFRKELETAIRLGIPAGEFVPYFEQQVDLETGELLGFEMLARWHSPRFGVVSPEVFVPVAEEIDLIADLSDNLLRQALEAAKDWSPRLTLSVNISPMQLRDPWFAQKLLQTLVETGFPPARLEIEITESCLHKNVAAVRSLIISLKNQGIRISLDDFGTGYSSLAQLRSLPFDQLKIDRSFVAELSKQGGNAGLVEAIYSLGRGLELPVIAEGIEDNETLASLKALGSLKGQGFLYGQPEDSAVTRARLAKLGLLVEMDVVPAQADIAADAGPALRKTA